MMNEWMKTVLSLSVSGTLLLLLLMGLKRFYQNRFSRRWRSHDRTRPHCFPFRKYGQQRDNPGWVLRREHFPC